ncbi:FmdB family regulatory protein [Xanthomonas arboricola pv. pruni str. MAFF 311562]|uniref:FmdB family regulatory protein n=1 Tax=Xanthomonas arboricola pv. pruni str. MAFF 311562 TaxID=1414836 RepID=W4S1T1_9XANT|nr:FmdB family regulatory protein [Xanthomonas arboricola pv. pruni str. MAFF 311562]GAE59631.1 hypothetical protein XPN_1537 [Xanthomonas arboricola pv. pruni MAFF 301427]
MHHLRSRLRSPAEDGRPRSADLSGLRGGHDQAPDHRALVPSVRQRWYETDFKSAGEKKKNLTESSTSAGGDAKPAAAAESKPAAKPVADPA